MEGIVRDLRMQYQLRILFGQFYLFENELSYNSRYLNFLKLRYTYAMCAVVMKHLKLYQLYCKH